MRSSPLRRVAHLEKKMRIPTMRNNYESKLISDSTFNLLSSNPVLTSHQFRITKDSFGVPIFLPDIPEEKPARYLCSKELHKGFPHAALNARNKPWCKSAPCSEKNCREL